jgi:alpha-L-glutamate ligase-like protein
MFKQLRKYQDLLGINARNLKYIRPYNHREAVKLADSKLKTKHYLSARNIPVPRLFGVIKNHEEIANFDFGSLPQNIVLKPNRGLGGEGIIAFKSRKGKNFITVGGRKISLEEIKAHITDIVDGRYSINNTPDLAFFEQRIINHPELEKYSYKGLPDIRIIVYNLVPVMAMLRLPTRESEGKANLAQGAVGVGIDLTTGKPTYISRKNKIVSEIPGVGKFDKDFRIPFFDEMLLIASKCQIITNLGYLACDIAIDETNGPILLEVNARAGLKVQLANKAPLQKRLEKLRDIKVSTPEKGVRIAKDLFGKRENILITKESKQIHTVGLEEIVELILPNEKLILKAKIDPDQEESIIDRSFQDKLKNINKNQAKVKITLAEKRLQTIVKFRKIKSDHDVIIGTRDIKDFLIDVNKKLESNTVSKLPKEHQNQKKRTTKSG